MSPPKILRTARSGRRRQLGMTLIEILIVLAILGLMVAGASSTIGASGQAEVVRVTNQLSNTLRFAFDKSRVSGTHMRVNIDLQHGTFTLQQADQADRKSVV